MPWTCDIIFNGCKSFLVRMCSSFLCWTTVCFFFCGSLIMRVTYTVLSMASWLPRYPAPCLDAVLMHDATAQASTSTRCDGRRLILASGLSESRKLPPMVPVSIMPYNGRVVSLHSRFQETYILRNKIKKLHKYIHMHIYCAHNICTTMTK